MTIPCECARYKTLRVYEVMTDTAVSLVEYARKTGPAPFFEVVYVMSCSLACILQAGHPGLKILQCVTLLCLMVLLQTQGLVRTCRWSKRPGSAHPPLGPEMLYTVQGSCILGRSRRPLRVSCSCRSVRCRPGAVGLSRAPAEVWTVSTPAACLLLSRFAPATARLFGEFRRLRDSLTPAEARKFTECGERYLWHADMLIVVRLCARPTHQQSACMCKLRSMWRH